MTKTNAKGVYVIARIAFLGSLIILLQGCTSTGARTVDGQQASDVMASFKSGEIRLTCHSLPCAGGWGSQRQKVQSLYKNRLWTDLAVAVSNVGYANDLPYFYLGQAAEGLGYPEAARIYYGLALASDFKCNRTINVCDGIDVPRASNEALMRLPESSNVSSAQNQQNRPSRSSNSPSVAPRAEPGSKKDSNRLDFRGTTTVKYNQLEKTTTYTGMNLGIQGDYLVLNAWRKDGGPTSIQIYLADFYYGDWRSYQSVRDSDGVQLDTTAISKEVIGCQKNSECSRTENIAINVSRTYLQSKRGSGIRFKISGKAGEEEFFIPGDYVAGFLETVAH